MSEEIDRIQARLAATETLLFATLLSIGRRDRALIQRIIDTLPAPAPDEVPTLDPVLPAKCRRAP